MMAPRALRTPRMIHEIIPVGWLKCNCSILGDRVTREALVLDPGDDVERILEALERHSLTVKAIVSTHAHIDHVGGLRKLQQATGAPVMMHGDDLDLYRHLDMQAAWLGVAAPDVANVDRLLAEGDTVRWGPFAANVLHTPGHTPGSISLYLANLANVSSIAGESGEFGKLGRCSRNRRTKTGGHRPEPAGCKTRQRPLPYFSQETRYLPEALAEPICGAAQRRISFGRYTRSLWRCRRERWYFRATGRSRRLARSAPPTRSCASSVGARRFNARDQIG